LLEILKNPKTEDYLLLKERIFTPDFPWYYHEQSTYDDGVEGHSNYPYYGHIILGRPEIGARYTEPKSSTTELAVAVVSEILKFNNENAEFFFTRMSVNSTYPIVGNQLSIPHHDHNFPHTNFMCYLNDNHGGGGRTFIDGHQPYEPVEDECIVFSGKHYGELPKKNVRVVIVATLITY
tara:strand:+ start:165 stop:701 length:537 start_codon:yes stop_codon:yes gene_type:complete